MRKVVFASKELRNGSINSSVYLEAWEKNHHKLAKYNGQLKDCYKLYDQYRGKQPSLTLEDPLFVDALLDALVEGNIKNIIVSEAVPFISLHTIYPLGSALNPEFITQHERAEKIFQRAISSKHVKDLYIDAMLSPNADKPSSWRLLFKSENDVKVKTGATCITGRRTIYLNSGLSDDEALSAFVFELTNATPIDRFESLTELAKKGEISRDEYAKKVEEVEFSGQGRHHYTMAMAIEEMGWSKSLDEYSEWQDNFEAVWPNIKDSNHTERYRKQWDFIQANAKTAKDKATLKLPNE